MKPELDFENSPFFPFADEQGNMKKAYDRVAGLVAISDSPIEESDRYQETLILAETGAARADLLVASLIGPVLVNAVHRDRDAASIAREFSPGVAEIAADLHDFYHPDENRLAHEDAKRESTGAPVPFAARLVSAGADVQTLKVAQSICRLERAVARTVNDRPNSPVLLPSLVIPLMPAEVPLKTALWHLYNEAATLMRPFAQQQPPRLHARFEAAVLPLRVKISGPAWRTAWASSPAAVN